MLNLDHIPHEPWVYLFKNASGKLLYIWKAKDLKKRVGQYFSKGSVWKQDMVAKATKVEFMVVNSDHEAYLLESNLISKHKPPYNSLLKGDSSYTYIKILPWDYPQIMLTRFRQNDGAIYIWPKLYAQELKNLLQFMRYLFQYRGCWAQLFNAWKLCSDYFFWLCKGRCVYKKLEQKNWQENLEQVEKVGFRKVMEVSEAKQEYQEIINLMTKFFNWDHEPLKKQVLEKINQAIELQHFEWAAKLRDIYLNLEKFSQKQTIEIPEPVSWVFYKIKRVWNYHVVAIIKLYLWKIVDVIRFKENANDFDTIEIEDRIILEYWKLKRLNKDENDIFWVSFELKKLDEKTKDEILILLNKFVESYIMSSKFDEESLLNQVLYDLQKSLELPNLPYKIEFVDISHLSWGWVSWALSCMLWGVLYKNGYRRYKLFENDDYQSLYDLMVRRFKIDQPKIPIEELDLPDLFVLDWGIWQLHIVNKLYNEFSRFREISKKVTFMSLWKWDARKRWWKLKGWNEVLYQIDQYGQEKSWQVAYSDEWHKLLIKLRDEAHRFANKYRSKQMEMEWK